MRKSRMKLFAGIISMATLLTVVSMGQVNTENIAANATQQLAGINSGLSDQQLRERATSIIPGTIIKAKYDYDKGRRTIEFDIIDQNGMKRELSLYTSDGRVEEIDYDYDAQGNRFIRQDLFKVNKTFEQAQQIALARVPGRVLATKQDAEHGWFIHEFFIQANSGGYYKLKVETENGTIISFERKSHFDGGDYYLPPVNVPQATPPATNQNTTPAPTTPPVTNQNQTVTPPVAQAPSTARFTEAKARQIALGAVPGTVLTVEYDYDDGRPEYEYKIKKSDGTVWEVKVVAPGWIDDIDYEGKYVNGIYYKD